MNDSTSPNTVHTTVTTKAPRRPSTTSAIPSSSTTTTGGRYKMNVDQEVSRPASASVVVGSSTDGTRRLSASSSGNQPSGSTHATGASMKANDPSSSSGGGGGGGVISNNNSSIMVTEQALMMDFPGLDAQHAHALLSGGGGSSGNGETPSAAGIVCGSSTLDKESNVMKGPSALNQQQQHSFKIQPLDDALNGLIGDFDPTEDDFLLHPLHDSNCSGDDGKDYFNFSINDNIGDANVDLHNSSQDITGTGGDIKGRALGQVLPDNCNSTSNNNGASVGAGAAISVPSSDVYSRSYLKNSITTGSATAANHYKHHSTAAATADHVTSHGVFSSLPPAPPPPPQDRRLEDSLALEAQRLLETTKIFGSPMTNRQESSSGLTLDGLTREELALLRALDAELDFAEGAAAANANQYTSATNSDSNIYSNTLDVASMIFNEGSSTSSRRRRTSVTLPLQRPKEQDEWMMDHTMNGMELTEWASQSWNEGPENNKNSKNDTGGASEFVQQQYNAGCVNHPLNPQQQQVTTNREGLTHSAPPQSQHQHPFSPASRGGGGTGSSVPTITSSSHHTSGDFGFAMQRLIQRMKLSEQSRRQMELTKPTKGGDSNNKSGSGKGGGTDGSSTKGSRNITSRVRRSSFEARLEKQSKTTQQSRLELMHLVEEDLKRAATSATRRRGSLQRRASQEGRRNSQKSSKIEQNRRRNSEQARLSASAAAAIAAVAAGGDEFAKVAATATAAANAMALGESSSAAALLSASDIVAAWDLLDDDVKAQDADLNVEFKEPGGVTGAAHHVADDGTKATTAQDHIMGGGGGGGGNNQHGGGEVGGSRRRRHSTPNLFLS